MISVLFIIYNQRYNTECEATMTVLDALEILRKNSITPLHYRHSCHHGSCGTCGAIINGVEGLMCLTKIGDLIMERKSVTGKEILKPEFHNETLIITLEPLKKTVHITGIAVHPNKLFESIPEEISYKKTVVRTDAVPLEPDESHMMLYEEYINDARYTGNPVPDKAVFLAKSLHRNKLELCIECGLCLSACPENFRGPAGLAAIHADLHKHETGDASYIKLSELIKAHDGVLGCKRHINCSRVCPQGVAPAKRIQELRTIQE